MSHLSAAVSTLLVLCTPAGLSAQGRVVNLTGAPVASLDESFSAINGFQEIAPDKVVVSDVNEQKLVLGDFKANSVKSIGRKGGGPGEWQMALNVLPAPNGTVYVSDPSLRRVHVVDATGRITGSLPFPGADGDGTPGRIVMSLPRGSDVQGRLYMTGSPFVPGQSDQPDSVPIIRWDPKTKRTDTLGMLRNETKVTQSGSPGSGPVRVIARVGGGPFSPTTVWQPMRDGRIAIVNPTPYRVDVVTGRNTVRRGTPVPYTPIKVTAAERAAYRERMKSNRPITMAVGGAGSGVRTAPNVTPQTIADAEFPATMAPFAGNGVHVTPEGEIWVLRSRPASDKVPTYDIFDGTGRLTGKATLNPHSTVVGFGANAVYVSRQDPEDDLIYLEKYRRIP